MMNDLLFIAIALLGAFIIGYLTGKLFRSGEKMEVESTGDANGALSLDGYVERSELEKALDQSRMFENEKNRLSEELAGLKAKFRGSKSKDDFDVLNVKYRKSQSDIKELSAKLADCEKKSNWEKPQKAPTKTIAKKAAPKKATPKKAAPKKTRTPFSGYSAKTKDDLKLISGVGPKLEKMLNKMGIYNFKQIAEFKASDLKKIDDNLETFQGRAKRDNWIGQAKKLVKK